MGTEFEGISYGDAERRTRIRRDPVLNGLDYLEVDTEPDAVNQRQLRVYFLPADPPDDPALMAKVDTLLTTLADPAHRSMLQLSGGVKTRGIEIREVHRASDHVVITVDRRGDFSDYVLRVVHPSMDPFFGRTAFSFKAGCPSRYDCRLETDDDGAGVTSAPHIDYLAKDYESFRQALTDYLPTIIPAWTERREADFGMSLLELFAYVGDRLSYYQDAVANEAYLETARQRLSVRRHTRLIDYALHDGLSAMTLLHCWAEADVELTGDVLLRAVTSPRLLDNPPPAVPGELAAQALDSADAVFEVLSPGHGAFRLLPAGPVRLYPDHNEIPLYTWGNLKATLPSGGTGADLAGALPHLAAGDLLLFEEVLSPDSGQAADRDPAHRQAVRLTRVREPQSDPLTGGSYTRVEWGQQDALVFDLCIAGQTRDGAQLDGVSVARGNLLPAFHGRTVDEEHTVHGGGPQNPLLEQPVGTRGYRFRLQQSPLGFLPSADLPALSVDELRSVQARGALPAVLQLSETTQSGGAYQWSAATGDLLGSGRFDPHFVVETDNDGAAVPRFGDNQFGMAPGAGSELRVSYRVGTGPGGNVGADSLVHFLKDPDNPAHAAISRVRNPLPAWGGVDPEPIAAVKAVAPAAFHARTYRAVTAADYARAAKEHPQVRDAAARLRWTGSWHTVFVYVDPLNAAELSPALAGDVADWVNSVTLAGYDLSIKGPVYVPLMVELQLCAEAGHLGRDVEQAVLRTLMAFFHPDRFGFGQPLYLSALLAAAERVSGVGSATAVGFARRYDSDPGATALNLARGFIAADPLEVLRLDNDPSFPENGLLTVRAGG
ncbi:hypothetical protein [Arthrobacter antioxidans]|uniref:hypothetical protein n=1 Tax=Arthrobacter antioxidans TaxID=2895818 RepID=UPI001FFF7DA7|nr:hypothetical protein [Arthrobacter antioxidans]